MPDVRVDAVDAADKEIFARYFQHYLSEQATFTGRKPSNGFYEYPWFDAYWQEPNCRWPFWMRHDDEFIALAFVRLDEMDGHFELAEFFVAEQFRGRGLGDRFVRDVILRFPGKWKLNQVKKNVRAIVFWRRVIGGLADYSQAPLRRDDGIDRIEQRFVIP